MSTRRRFMLGGPKWWRLYLLFVLFVGAGLGEAQLPLPEIAHRVIEVGLVVGLYFLAVRWLKANEVAMLHESMRQHRDVMGQRRVVESNPIALSAEDGPAQSRNAAIPTDPTPHVTYRTTGVDGRLHPVVSNDRRRRNRRTLS